MRNRVGRGEKEIKKMTMIEMKTENGDGGDVEEMQMMVIMEVKLWARKMALWLQLYLSLFPP